MIHTPDSLKRIGRFIHSHVYISIAVVLLCAGISATTVVLAVTGNDTPPPAASARTTTAKKQSVKGAESTTNAAPTSASTQPAKSAQPIQKTATTAAKPSTPASQHRLLISPATITIPAGGSANVTVKTDDGRGVTMPMVSSNNPSLMTNFPAAPFKSTWTGSIGSMVKTTPAGTYTVTLQAQADRATWYSGTLTLIITATPTATVSVRQTGYDAPSGTLSFNVKLNRQNGYAVAIQRWYASNFNASLECAFYDGGNADTFDVDCHYPAGSGPNSGTLNVNIFMDSGEVFSGSTGYQF